MELKNNAKYVDAGAKFLAALQADPNNADALWGGAWVAAEMGQKEAAKQGFEKFITVSKDSGKVSKAKAAISRLSK